MKRGAFLKSLLGLPVAAVTVSEAQGVDEVEFHGYTHWLYVPVGDPEPNPHVIVGERYTKHRKYGLRSDKDGELYFVDEHRGTVRRLS